jgi:predicted RNA-binding Zn-ribbon protein involved in translation (DUF1610 family)
MKQLVILLLLVLCSTTMFAQNASKTKHKKARKTSAATMYTCSMDPEVTSTKPGKCPKCGMDLVKAKPVVYACPMHAEVTSNKPGKCAKCGMDLEVKKDETTGLKTTL